MSRAIPARSTVLLLCLAFASQAAPAQKRPISERDLFDFVWIGDPQVSADGARVAFVRVTVNEKKDGYDSSIWSVPTAGGEAAHALTSGKHDGTPRWSPDGRYLLFVRATEKDGKVQDPQLWLLPRDGGDSFAVTDLPRGASAPEWSPDGKRIAFLSRATADDVAKRAHPQSEGAGRESDVHVITRADYRSNDDGYIDYAHPEHIWSVEAPRSAEQKPAPQPVTSGRFDESNPVWAPDSSRLYFTSTRLDEPYYELPTTGLYAVPATGGAPLSLATLDMDVHSMAPSPDGRRLAFIAEASRPVRSYSQPDLWLIDLVPGAAPRNVTAPFDWDVGDAVFGDNASPRAGGGNRPIWTADGGGLLEMYSREGRTYVARFDATTGAAENLTQGDQAVLSFRAAPAADKLVYVLSTPTQINDLYVRGLSPASSGQPVQLTHANDALFAQLDLPAPEELWYKSFDGRRIQAWIQKPPDFDPHRKYPLILDIHGGPHAAYGFVFDHEFQWMAAKGYVVLYPNPRGSTTYGQAFGNVIQYRYPGDDYKDLMAGVDAVIRLGYVDPGKLGVTGGSGGGLLTNWVVGHTTRFAAAVSQRDIADWSDWWYGSDIVFFHPNWFKGAPFEEASDYRARSPITYVNRVKTPLMLVLGDADVRTPPESGGEQMFRALKYRRIPTVMVRFPNETHELSRSGQPWHRVERLQHILGWFDHWLLDVPKPEYGPVPTRKQEVPK
jgi:dipeptidyl aminopeptidase/acylaminoacyl peptidase